MKDRKCLRCGKPGRYISECYSQLTCYLCKGKHWTPFCFGGKSNPSASKQSPTFRPTVDGAKKDPNLNVQKAVVSKPTNEKNKKNNEGFSQ